jgi:hypothetical protein
LTGGGWNDSFIANIVCEQKGASCPSKLDTPAACFAAASHNIGIKKSVAISTAEGNSTLLPSGCSVQVNGTSALVFFNTNTKSTACCGGGADTIEGVQESLVTLGMRLSGSGGTIINMTGPADGNWFGVGFNTHYMANSPYAIVVDGTGAVSEHVLGDHVAGTVLAPSIKVVSQSVVNGQRTVVMTRALKGLTPQHHDFDYTSTSMDFISAVGSSSAFSYHKQKTVSTIAMWPVAPAPRKAGTYSFFGGQAAAGTRNEFSGEVGYQITPKGPLTVTSLGRAVNGAALRAAATVHIWDVAAKKVVATASIGPNASIPVQGYSYIELTAPVVLQAGSKYIVTQVCSPSMLDKWVNDNSNAKGASPLAVMGDGIYSAAANTMPTTVAADPKFVNHGRWSGIATFKVKVVPNPHPPPATACVCGVPATAFGKGTGTLKYLPTGEVIGFPPRCELFPRETVLRDHNPTCDIRTYAGGLSTCHHKWHLLDQDQEVPWQDQPLVYYMKFRMYFQEYNPAQHKIAYEWNFGIGGATGEYDVPQCPAGTPVENCTHEITGVIEPPSAKMHFVAAHFHCHAPTCLKMEIYNNKTGELLCREEPYYGQTKNTTGKDRFDEKGYIAQVVHWWCITHRTHITVHTHSCTLTTFHSASASGATVRTASRSPR